eukprot:scaffold114160_cov40-Attheya_sp.AAC.1
MESDESTHKIKKKAAETDWADEKDVEVPEIFYPWSSNSATAKKAPSRGFKGNTSMKPPAKHPPHTQQDSQVSLKKAIRADGTRPTRTKRLLSTSTTDGALQPGVGAFNVVPLYDGFDDHNSHNDRQTAKSETAQFESANDGPREARRNDGDLAVADAVHDNDAFIPSATQYNPGHSKSSPLSQNRRLRLYGFAGIYILLVIIVVSIIIAVIRNNRKSDNQILDDGSGSQTTFPTPGPTTAREGEGILGELINISSIEKLNDPNSAQFKAAQWIQFEDTQQLGVDADNLLQRYALVVMYFSLQENGSWFFCGANDSSHKDPDLCTDQIVVDFGADPRDPNDNIYEELEFQ